MIKSGGPISGMIIHKLLFRIVPNTEGSSLIKVLELRFPLHAEVSSFQGIGIGIEGFCCIQRGLHPILKCAHFRNREVPLYNKLVILKLLSGHIPC